MTKQLLWEEYKSTQPEGYQYSQFCERYARWAATVSVVMRQDRDIDPVEPVRRTAGSATARVQQPCQEADRLLIVRLESTDRREGSAASWEFQRQQGSAGAASPTACRSGGRGWPHGQCCSPSPSKSPISNRRDCLPVSPLAAVPQPAIRGERRFAGCRPAPRHPTRRRRSRRVSPRCARVDALSPQAACRLGARS